LEEFGQLCKEDLSMDENLDQKLKEHMRDPSGPEIIESRLAGWWADELQLNCLRVWLKVEGDERARRVAEREGGDSAHWKELAELRMERDQARYWQLYQIDLNDPKPYNCIITTDDLQAEEVFQQVLSALQEGL
jgi:cytidylate kinase